jgi:L-erythrulose 1-phosphate isomerase
MARPFLFGTNFKMNQTPATSAAFYRQLAASVAIPPGVQLFVIPPYTSLAAVADIAVRDEPDIWVGAQNVHWAPEGAYTGEISVAMLVALGVDLVLLGHAERETIVRQTKIGLHGVAADQVGLVQIAYEPVWSIGAGGTPASPEDVAPMAVALRGALNDIFGAPGEQAPILYGGSVDPSNAGSFTALPDIDGLFVGRAAWTVDGFIATYEAGLAGRG